MKAVKAPDYNPVKPSYTPPPKACDAHCHIFGPEATFPFSAKSTYKPADAPKEMLRKLHAHLGLDRAVLVQASCHGTDNRAMLDAIADSNDAYRGVAMVEKDVSDRELTALHEGGVRGIRFNFVKHLGGAPDFDTFHSTIDRIKDMGWHVVLHLDSADILTYQSLLDGMPVPFIIDHMGRAKVADGIEQAPFQSLLKLMRTNEKAWVKICGAERISAAGAPFRDAIPFAAALIESAPDRVLWGTDFPHPNISGDMPNDGELVNLFAEMCTDEAVRHRILVDNPERLYWKD
ncbi:Predicted metal-dependent hydrolase, TIM-barrel fold [Noviherbaspirillum humi]|uniref:Predicted metal-dependent hydrolase, TIM-barrel fold n=1 Tax=Noviherbaspirillum humi TaxID=1688639 RepID=A0A239JNQ7_9BURK|nr:amidohydrolase family protein [Noviherbaspirillum humi]SNT07477.1 Predicted metal-dependent hydrolase, TIM-barrel fold [Noviherbaspirillum humi]